MNRENIPELKQEKNFFGRWADFFIKKYKVTFLFIFMILILGINSYKNLPRELSPEVVLPYGYVSTIYPGAAPNEIENLVTNEIESRLDSLDNVVEIQSTSTYGASFVFVEFNEQQDKDEIVDDISEKLNNIESDLPDDVNSPNIMKIQTNNSPILYINIAGNYEKVQLKNIAENLKKEVLKTKDIESVDIIGGLEREISVVVDKQKLSNYKITLSQIVSAIKNSNLNLPGGNITLDGKNYNIRTIGEFENISELENIIIRSSGNMNVYLADIAEIKDGYKDINSYSRLGRNTGDKDYKIEDTLTLIIRKDQNGDIIKVTDEIKDRLQETRGSVYPEDLTINYNGELAQYVKDQLQSNTENARAGLLIVVVVLFLFIGFKEALVVSLVIPLSLFTAFILMFKSGMTFNNISLFSLIFAVGMIVDNGIIIMENIDRLRNKGVETKKAASLATNQIAPAITASTLTTLSAFFPLFLTSGMMGEFIKDIPRTVIFTLSASLIIAITVTPTLSSIFLKGKKTREYRLPVKLLSVFFVFAITMLAFKDDTGYTNLSWIFATLFSIGIFYKLFVRLDYKDKESVVLKKYQKLLCYIIKKTRRKIAFLFVMNVLFFASIYLIVSENVKIELFSQTDQNSMDINITLKEGTTLDETLKVSEKVEEKLTKYDQIDSFITNVGKTGNDGLSSFESSSTGTPNKAAININLKDEKDRNKSSIELASMLEEDVKKIPGAKIEISQLREGPPSGKAISIDFQGENIDVLKKVADDMTRELENIAGVTNASNSVEVEAPEIKILVDKQKAKEFGFDNLTISLLIRDFIEGIKVTKYRQNQEEIDVILKLKDSNLESVNDLENLYFINNKGDKIQFKQFANIVEGSAPTSIYHKDGERFISVTSDLKEGYLPTVVMDKFLEKVEIYEMPNEISYKVSGEVEETTESFINMLSNMAIAGLLVYIILVFQFNSLIQPMIILTTVPLSLIGVIPGLYITNNNFGFVAFIGVVALVGIAVNDAIVLIDYINYLRNNGYGLNEAIKETGKTRFVPVLATTITTTGGILPITLKQKFFEPMGIALIFGLLTATILTLLVVPTIYSIIYGSIPEFVNRKRGKIK